MNEKRWYLGNTKGSRSEAIYLTDFTWDCGWYWGGGYVGNRNMHCHFDGCFLDVPDIRGHALGSFITPWTKLPDYIKKENCTVVSNGCSVWEPLSTFLDNPQYSENQWWRIKDLFRQFYTMKAAAEVFQYGGHCSSRGQTKDELNPAMAQSINKHIADTIIPEIRKALDKATEIV